MSTYSRIFLHIVFGTKHRDMIIPDDIRERLYAFVGGIVRDERGIAIAIGGMPDHIHLLVAWRTDDTVANLVRNIKSRSSAWLHETFTETRAFTWQEGYGVFSVSESQREKVVSYITNQREHHAVKSYREELVELLHAHGVSFDERYLPHGDM